MNADRIILLLGTAGVVMMLAVVLAKADMHVGKHYAAGCDQNWCWPSYTLTRPVMPVYLDRAGIEQVCGRGKYACAINDSGPICRVILPLVAPRQESMEKLEAHEGRHCEGHEHE